MSVVVIGSSNIDIVVSTEKIPRPGETVLGISSFKNPGGKGANQAVACAKLGCKTTFLSALGNTGDEKTLTDMFESCNLDYSKVKRVEGLSGTAYINVDRNGQNSIVVIPGANSLCDVPYIESCKTIIDKASVILLSMEIPYETVKFACEYAHSRGVNVVLNPAPVSKDLEDSIFKNVDIITPNETELEILTSIKTDSISNIKKASEKLIDKGVGKVIVTLGENGCLYTDSEFSKHYKTNKVKVVDTTGAGDTFNGALCAFLSEGKTLEEAINLANKAASISVTRKGAQISSPKRDEVIC